MKKRTKRFLRRQCKQVKWLQFMMNYLNMSVESLVDEFRSEKIDMSCEELTSLEGRQLTECHEELQILQEVLHSAGVYVKKAQEALQEPKKEKEDERIEGYRNRLINSDSFGNGF